jgi:hypothetical protein
MKCVKLCSVPDCANEARYWPRDLCGIHDVLLNGGSGMRWSDVTLEDIALARGWITQEEYDRRAECDRRADADET